MAQARIPHLCARSQLIPKETPLQEHTKTHPRKENAQGTAEIHKYLLTSQMVCTFFHVLLTLKSFTR